jgi:hypothetical protein
MNILFLIHAKIINHKRLELFESRQLQHLLEILFYHGSDFDSTKVQEKLGLAWFWWFGGPISKKGKTALISSFPQVPKFRNLTNSKTRPLKGDPLDFTQNPQIVCEL